jgi:hypothetical protein
MRQRLWGIGMGQCIRPWLDIKGWTVEIWLDRGWGDGNVLSAYLRVFAMLIRLLKYVSQKFSP